MTAIEEQGPSLAPDELQDPFVIEQLDAVESERATVGALLSMRGTAQREILAMVRDDEFCDRACAWLVARIREMVEYGRPVDRVTLIPFLQEHGHAGDPAFRRRLGSLVASLVDEAPPLVQNALWYAGQVVAYAARRRARVRYQMLAEKCLNGGSGSLEELRELAEAEHRRAMEAFDRALELWG